LRELKNFGWGAVGIYAVTLAGVVAKDLLTGVIVGLALSALRLLRKLGSFDIEIKQVPGSQRLDVVFRGALTFVGLPRLATTLENLPAAQDIHVHVDQLRYIDHACLVQIGDFERQARQRGQTVTIDWTDLDTRSEKRVPPTDPEVRQLQPSM
jgi:MFS superfamily sulfate permease-like transporter